MAAHPLHVLHDAFADLADPRVERTKEHRLLDIVGIAICAVICGADSWVAVEEFGNATQAWRRQVLALPNGIPSHDTFGRVFAALDAEQFQQGFLDWVRAVWPARAGEVVAVDGKTVRGSPDRGMGKTAMHLVRAWANQRRVVLAQRKVNEKSNEITAIPDVLGLLDLTGCTVTMDAMGCQTTIAQQIVRQDANYVLAVKENHAHLYQDIADTLRYAQAARWQKVGHDQQRTVDGDHGRVEVRQYWLIQEAEVLAYLNPQRTWVGLAAIGMVTTERTTNGVPTSERRYYILSGTPTAQAFAYAVRGHWGIETSVHWVLDVTFDEDRSRIRRGNAPQNFAVLRHIALNLLRHEPSKGSINTKRFRAALDDSYLLKVLRA